MESATFKIKLGDKFVPIDQIQYDDDTPVAIEMWYDRHFRHWVLYPVDKHGYQLTEAKYGFGKSEALEIKSDLEAEYGIK